MNSGLNNSRILVLAAHPDDEVLGCGGTITRMAREGHEVYIAILGEGITSRYLERQKAEPHLVRSLQSISHQVAKTIGAKELFTYNLPDNRLDTVPLLDIIKIIESLIRCLSPSVVYTHHGGDLNVDHQLVHRAVLTATRPVKDYPVREVYTFEVPSSTEWSFQQTGPVFRPNTFVDISTSLETKLKAMSLYDTEVRFFPHPRSPEALQAIARRWGSIAGCDAAEAFELVRAIR